MSALSDSEDPPPNQPPVHLVRDESDAPQPFPRREPPSLADPVLQRLASIEAYMARAEARELAAKSRDDEVLEELGDLKKHQTARNLEYAAHDAVKNGLSELTILVVEPDGDLLRSATNLLAKLGCIPSPARSRQEALTLLAKVGSFDMALVELRLPSSQDGVSLCRDLLRAYPAMAIVLMGTRLRHPELDSLRVARLKMAFTADELNERLYEIVGHQMASRDTERPPAFGGSDEETEPSIMLPSTGRETPDAKRNE